MLMARCTSHANAQYQAAAAYPFLLALVTMPADLRRHAIHAALTVIAQYWPLCKGQTSKQGHCEEASAIE